MGSQKPTLLVLVVALLGSALTVLSARYVVHLNSQQSEQRLQRLGFQFEQSVVSALEANRAKLHAAAGLLRADDIQNGARFQRIARFLQSEASTPGMAGIGFIEWIPDSNELDEFSSDPVVAADQVLPRDPGLLQGRMIVRYIEPLISNRQFIHRDVGREPLVRSAAEHAFLLGQPVLSSPVAFESEDGESFAALLLSPVYKSPEPADAVARSQRSDAERWQESDLMGWVCLPILPQSIFSLAQRSVDSEINYTATDGTSFSEDRYIASSTERNWQADMPTYKTELSFAERKWLIELTPSADFVSAGWLPLTLTLAIGSCLTLVMVGLFLGLFQCGKSTRLNMTEDVRRLAMVAERTTNAVILTDVHRKITWVNSGFTRITGYLPHEVVGKVPGRILQSDRTDPETVANIRNALDSGIGFSGELANRHKDGTHYWIHVDIQPLRDERGELIGFLAIESDITQQKEFAAELKAANDRAEYALAGGKMGLWNWDLEDDSLSVDRYWKQIFGESEGRICHGQSWLARVHPEDVGYFELAIQQSLTSTTGTLECEHRIRMNSERGYQWLLVRGQVIERNAAGKATKMAGTITEISALKETEAALRESEAKAKSMFLCSNDAIILYGPKGITDCNPKATELLGLRNRGELLGRNFFAFAPALQADGRPSEVVAAEIVAAVAQRGYDRFEWLQQRADGRVLEVEVVISKFDIDEEEISQAIIRDVSERKALERKLVQSQKLESIGHLAAGVAHEINTPMQCITSNLEYIQGKLRRTFEQNILFYEMVEAEFVQASKRLELREAATELERTNEGMLEAVVDAYSSSERVTKIVRAMKTVSLPGSVDKVPTDFNKLIEDVVLLSQNRWRYISNVTLDLSSDVKDVLLQPAQMSQAVLHLIFNAADAIQERLGSDAADPGNILVKTTADASGVTLKIKDTGCGMSSYVAARVFDPFFTTKEVGKGSGQGLAMAYDVINNQHGGQISLKSTEGQGTVFTVFLPHSSPSVAQVLDVERIHAL